MHVQSSLERFIWICTFTVLVCECISVGTLEESLKLSPELFEQKFSVRAPEKDDDNIVFHCRSGVRSSKALGIAHQLGFAR